MLQHLCGYGQRKTDRQRGGPGQLHPQNAPLVSYLLRDGLERVSHLARCLESCTHDALRDAQGWNMVEFYLRIMASSAFDGRDKDCTIL